MQAGYDLCPLCGGTMRSCAKMCRKCFAAGKARRDIQDLFWTKVDRRGPDECWNWTASLFRTGYGKFNVDGRLRRAHRVSWEFAHGQPAPDGMDVCHTCDNRACVNPAHLFLGTRLDNMQDASRKGRCRSARGEQHRSAKLTAADVLAIRAAADAGVAVAELARQYYICPTHCRAIVLRHKWKHI